MLCSKLQKHGCNCHQHSHLVDYAGDLKKQCETVLGVVSQCCLTKHVYKMSKQYLANVALKINVKVAFLYSQKLAYWILMWATYVFCNCTAISCGYQRFSEAQLQSVGFLWFCCQVGGRNTVLVDALTRRIPLVSDIPTIIFGADVTHPHPGEDSSPSIAAVSIINMSLKNLQVFY